MQICYLAHNKYTDLCFFDTEKIICDLIKLCSNNTEINIQIKRFCPNYITANIYSTIGCDRFICFCIEKDSSYISGMVCILILYIGEDLIDITGVQCILIKPVLKCFSIVFRINDKNPIMQPQSDICLHHRQKLYQLSIGITDYIPLYLCCSDFGKISMVFSVVFKNKAFVQTVHMLIRKRNNLKLTLGGSL